MQLDFWQMLILMGAMILLAMLCFLAGAYVMFRGRKAPGEGFFAQPKGEVFTIPEAETAPDFPEDLSKDERQILARTNKFLEKLKGEGNGN